MRLVGLVLAIWPLLLAAQPPAEIQPEANPQAARPEDKCAIEGQVANAQTGDPLKKARVRLYNNDGRQNHNYSAATDAGGHFIIQEIEPGNYMLFGEHNGFSQAQYSATGTNGGPTPLALGAGQRLRDLNLRLVPFGVITGRILDEDGEPVEHVNVAVTRYGSRRVQLSQAGAGQTDDLGEYRIFGLEAGKYYLSATYNQRNLMAAQDRTPDRGPDEGYAPTFYPGTSDPAGATAINVVPGAQLRGVDITLLKTRTWRIRGRVINGLGESLPRPVYIMLLPGEKAHMGFHPGASTQIRDADGSFELRGVTPGSYVLMAQCFDGGKGYAARQPVDVGNDNVENISLLMSAGMDLKGVVRVDGPGGAALGNLQVSLAPQEMMRMGMQGAKVGDDGSFSMSGVPPAIYTIDVYGMSETFYVKSVRMGDADGLEAGLDLTHGGAGALEIVLSPNGGQVDGSVVDSKQTTTAAALVLAPEGRRREQRSLFKMANADAQGHFTIKGIAPGDYKLFAWAQIDDPDYQDPEFLKPYENKGESVTIRENGRESVQLKLIEPDTKASKPGN
jgi:protocatechuate 3,4-dioxygenase beta subunit